MIQDTLFPEPPPPAAAAPRLRYCRTCLAPVAGAHNCPNCQRLLALIRRLHRSQAVYETADCRRQKARLIPHYAALVDAGKVLFEETEAAA